MARLAIALVVAVAGCTATSDPVSAPGGQPTVSNLRRAPGGKAERQLRYPAFNPFGAVKLHPLRRPARRADRDEQRTPTLNWPALSNCESGGNPRTDTGNGYYGEYQFAESTWASVGGRGNPADASPGEQTYRAGLLYARDGAAPMAAVRLPAGGVMNEREVGLQRVSVNRAFIAGDGYRPLLLEPYCGAGGAAMGYYKAGFDVVGIDIKPQPHYPFAFVQGDALEMLDKLLRYGWIQDSDGTQYALSHFDAIHASPPCQSYLNLGGVNRKLGRRYDHPDLIDPTRELLLRTHLPYVIENVPDAAPELRDPVRVCGTAFGLPLRRHRLFEASIPIEGKACEHDRFTEPRYWTGWRPNGEHRLSTVVQVYGNAGGRSEWPAAMGIDWMTSAEMIEAVPPAYTEHIGAQLLAHIRGEVAA